MARISESSKSHSTWQSGSTASSQRSTDTAPTEYSTRPQVPRTGTCLGRVEGHQRRDYFEEDARTSVDTYASTSEEEDLDDDDDAALDHVPEYHVPQYHHEPLPADAIPTTPRDFADLFPTSKRISIRHDDSTIDGNMNLRIDTQVEEYNRKKQNYTLFHLRMHDLRTREFSLRRYCRDSGREVCHSIRKYQKPPPEKRPVLQRASTALASLRHKPDSRPSTAQGLKRSDSGYESVHGVDPDAEDESRPQSAGYAKGRALLPTNTLKLEFSNYAHIDVKRRGRRAGRDEHILRSNTDISDVVIATGILSLVDDCIKRRFHTKQSTQLHIPLLRNKLHLDYVGPKRLIDEMFNRTGRGGQAGRQTSALRRPATQA
ncbi:hypothetical protein GRF29_69g354552 [Pseudopithomyces chartarum]|uniref:Uncharacterized protein n=1 Tax=Pseudopithomyces chartarum TaxID=1892770 RepID=A0AAN6LZL1_9PLEO|nr:hypothetical protein GRF29_69g354552 [Pseudopithomyces chartarum]